MKPQWEKQLKEINHIAQNIGLLCFLIPYFLTEPIIKRINRMTLFKGMDDNQFWLTLWTFCLTTFIVLITTIAWSSYKEDKMVQILVQEGHDPMELACLYNSSERLESACMILSQAKAEQIKGETDVSK